MYMYVCVRVCAFVHVHEAEGRSFAYVDVCLYSGIRAVRTPNILSLFSGLKSMPS